MPTPEPVVYEADCVICGKHFHAERRFKQHEGRSTCSLECMGKLSHLRRKGIVAAVLEQEQQCPECAQVFMSRRRTPKMRFPEFCSQACIGKRRGRKMRNDSWQREQQQVCVVCGTGFMATRRRKTDNFRVVCSIECQGKRREARLKRACRRCGVIFWQERSVVERTRRGECYCSPECYAADRLEHKHDNGLVKGRKIDKGYILAYAPSHPKAKSGYVYEHRLVMEQMLGRYLVEHENVHHIDGSRGNNLPENLELWVSPQPYGQRAHDLYKQDVERLGRENLILKQRIADLEAELQESGLMQKE